MSKFLIVLSMLSCAAIHGQEPASQDFVKHNMTQKVLIDKMYKAIDPDGVCKKWKTVINKIEMVYPVQKVKLLGSGIGKYPDKIKTILKFSNGTTIIEVVNGKQAWRETTGQGIKMKSGTQLAFAKFRCKKTNPALKITEVYEKITLDPVLYKFGKHKCYKLICALPGEINVEPEIFFVDNKKFLIRWYVSSQFMDNESIPVYREFLSYKKIKGVNLPMKQNIYIKGGMIVQNTLSLKINEKIPDSEFELPKEKVK